LCNQVGNFKQVIDVRLGGMALSALMNMPLGGKIGPVEPKHAL
jgi:hypothetical protein